MNLWIEPVLKATCLLGSLLFFWSLWSKLFSLSNFLRSITQLVAIPNAWVPWVAAAVLLGEAVIAFSLSFFAFTRIILLLASIMLSGFTVALVSASIKKKTVQCSCFGESNKATRLPLSIARNIIFIGISISAFFMLRFYPVETITSPQFLFITIECSLIIVWVKYGVRIRKEMYS